jgi:hypothetical protein
MIGFNIIKHHYIQHILTRLKGSYVIVMSFHIDHLRLNLYCIVPDERQTDLCIPTNGQPGITGGYHYILDQGKLYHALIPTRWSRQRGFFHSEPVMSYRLFLTDRQQNELEEHTISELAHLAPQHKEHAVAV